MPSKVIWSTERGKHTQKSSILDSFQGMLLYSVRWKRQSFISSFCLLFPPLLLLCNSYYIYLYTHTHTHTHTHTPPPALFPILPLRFNLTITFAIGVLSISRALHLKLHTLCTIYHRLTCVMFQTAAPRGYSSRLLLC